MDDLLKLVERLATHAVGRRVRHRQLGKVRLYLQKSCVHHIVFVIGYLGRIVYVIALGVIGDIGAELFGFSFYLLGRFFYIHSKSFLSSGCKEL